MNDYWADSHIGRSFGGHSLEDECPCPQEPCGLVAYNKIDPDCPQHSPAAAKTMRQGHPSDQCPANDQLQTRILEPEEAVTRVMQVD